MKLIHIKTAIAILGFSLNAYSGDRTMCGAPAMCGTPAIAPGVQASVAKGKSAVERSAEEMVAQLAPERQSDLLILLNEATQERLLAINGIAATRAAAIIKARPISSLADLVSVKGIGVTTLTRILSHDPNAVESSELQDATEAMVEGNS